MQNTKLDTTISVPDQELSSVEYIDARENSIATITRDGASVQDVEDPRSLQLIFGQKHNGIDCALCPTAKRACNRAWVTAKQIENWSKMSTMTLWRRLNKLEDVGRICRLSDMIKTPIQDSCGVPHETTLYNLNVLIVWACFLWRCKKVVDVQSHSDYIVPCTTHQAHDCLRSCWHP